MSRQALLKGVLSAAVLLAATPQSQAGVVINEIMYHPPSYLGEDEFLELHNPGASIAVLDGWCLDGLGFCFPPGAVLAPGQYLVLARDAAAFQATYGLPPDYVYPTRLDNAGERIALLDAGSQLVDEVLYLDVPPWPVTPDGLGPSLEVIDPTEDNASPRNWRASTAPAGHTVGAINSVDTEGLPPWISDVVHSNDLQPDDPIVITATVQDATLVELDYLIDFSFGNTLTMLDDGMTGDGGPNDGVYGVVITGQPASTLVRYRIRATGPTGTLSLPRTDDTVDYTGTIVTDPTLSSNQPIFHWYIDPADYDDALDHVHTDETEPAVLFHDGVLYDNIEIRVRGKTARNWHKKHWKFAFPQGHEFFDIDLIEMPADNFNLQANFSDKSHVREILSYETARDAGSPSNQVFHVRVQQNGAFFGLYHYLEAPDREWAIRNGLDENGARYKAFDNLRIRSIEGLQEDYEKKSRLHEDYSDLFDFVLDLNNLSGSARRDFLFDNVDLPATINYLAFLSVIHGNDHVSKNYFVYRDTEGTGRWMMHLWDMDLTFGRNYNGTVLNDDIWADVDVIPGLPDVSPSHPLFGDSEHQKYDYHYNHLIDAMYEQPEIREMYFRRLRTLVDEFLLPGRYEARIDALAAPIMSEAVIDEMRWGHYGSEQSLTEATDILKNDYLIPRRTHLLVTHRVPGEIPDAQIANPPIVINEIMYQPLAGPDHEFVEFYNPSTTEAVDVSGWRLGGVGLTIPAGTVILPDDFAVVVRNDVAFRAEYGSGKFVAAEYNGALVNEGERLTLFDRDGNQVALVEYSNAAPWPTSPAGTGPSLELIDPAQANGWAANWAASGPAGGTPGLANSVAATITPFPGLFINEVLPINVSINSDENGDFHPWIEVYNASGATVDMGGMYLTNIHALPVQWQVPPGTTICDGCWLLFWADNEPGQGPLHTNFQLNPFGGTVGLYDAGGKIIDYLDYDVLPSDVSFGRFPDGSPDTLAFSQPTPADANVATPVPLILNEYNAVAPDETLKSGGSDTFWGPVRGNGGDWFELVVTVDNLDIRGWELVISDDTGGTDETVTTLVLSNDALWSNLQSGTLITVSEELADDVSFDPAEGDWWINVQASSTSASPYISNQDFDVSNRQWQLTIRNDLSEDVFGPAGEGIKPGSGIGNDEVFKLEQDPTPFLTPFANYNDGTSSTFGSPNVFAAGTQKQDFSTLRCGQGCTYFDGFCGIGVCDGATGLCEVDPLNEGLTCDDGDACTPDDTCTGGLCTGPSTDCSGLDDQCNVGVCNPGDGQCEAQPINEGLGCDDSDLCTEIDICSLGTCAGAVIDCSSVDDLCHTGVCNPGNGQCESQQHGDSTPCILDACTTGATCTGGVCGGGSSITCNDSSTCTVDSCDPGSGCVFTPDDDQNGDSNPDPCIDGLSCTDNDICSGGVCTGTNNCDPGEACDPSDQCLVPQIVYTFRDGGTYTGTQDAYLAEHQPDDTNGTLNDTCGGEPCDNFEWDSDVGALGVESIGLLRFDGIVGSGANQIPRGSTVVSATLTLTVMDPGEEPPGAIHLSLVDWDETTATWNNFGGDPGVQWADEVGDFVADAPYADGTHVIVVTTTVQGWIDDPASNLGLIFLPFSDNGVHVWSSESAVLAERPLLTIEAVVLHCEDDGICGDGVLCNGAETCNTGTNRCEDAAPLDCDDSVACTDDSCVEISGCLHSPNHGLCDDSDVCTLDVCDTQTGCDNTPDEFAPCDDLNDCTTGDTCDAVGSCVGTVQIDGTSCEDGDLCTENEECTGGVCGGSPVDCSSLDDQCNNGACNPSSGGCEAQPINEGLGCDDGDLCTENTVCTVGSCVGTPIDCSAFDDDCHAGVCNPGSGLCEAQTANEGGVCDDGDACTTGETCSAGTCGNGTSVDCSDGVGCTNDSCDSISGCLHSPNDVLCDDADICTGIEGCDTTLGCILCPAGELATALQIADSTGDGAVPLEFPDGLAADAEGNVYVAGSGLGVNDSVFKITELGAIARIIGVPDGLGHPIGVAVDGAGNVYVAGHLSDNVFKVEPGGAITEVIDATGDGSAPLSGPVGIAVDDDDNLYVTGFFSNNVFKIEPGGAINEIIDATGDGTNALSGPEAVAVEANGDVYVVGRDSNNAFRITPTVTVTQIIDSTGDGTNPLLQPVGVAVDGLGNAYLTGLGSDNVFKIEPGGTVTTLLDAAGDGSGSPLDDPTCIDTDTYGNVYVGGYSSNNVFKITPPGVILPILDSTGDGVNSFAGPLGDCIDIDEDGAVFVTGTLSQNVFKIDVTCPAGDPLDCDDENICTDDSCDSVTGCSNIDNTAACEDGDLCTVGDSCSAGGCVSGSPMDCEDGGTCSTGTCIAGTCEYTPTGLCGVSGAVRYYRSHIPVGAEPSSKRVTGVDIDINEDGVTDATTDSTGDYGVNNLAGRVVVETLDMSDADPVDSDRVLAITASDARDIAKHSVFLITLSSNQQIAGDINADGFLRVWDAQQVSTFAAFAVVGSYTHFPVANNTGSDWAFVRCDNYTDAGNHDCTGPFYVHDPLMAPEVDDFYAILYGDVTGNWSPPSGSPAESTEEPPVTVVDGERAVELRAALLDPQTMTWLQPGADHSPLDEAELELTGWSAPEIGGTQRRELILEIREGDGILAFDFRILFDPSKIKIVDVRTVDLTADFTLVKNDLGGDYRAVMYDVLPIQGSGAVLAITVDVKSGLGREFPLKIRAVANETPIPIHVRGSEPLTRRPESMGRGGR